MRQEIRAVFEWLRKKGGSAAADRSEDGTDAPAQQVYRIEFDRMLKGSIIMRRGRPVRQCGVTVDGSTRLVTSGDTVDRETYEALLAAGIVQDSLHERSRKMAPPADPASGPRKPNAEAS